MTAVLSTATTGAPATSSGTDPSSGVAISQSRQSSSKAGNSNAWRSLSITPPCSRASRGTTSTGFRLPRWSYPQRWAFRHDLRKSLINLLQFGHRSARKYHPDGLETRSFPKGFSGKGFPHTGRSKCTAEKRAIAAGQDVQRCRITAGCRGLVQFVLTARKGPRRRAQFAFKLAILHKADFYRTSRPIQECPQSSPLITPISFGMPERGRQVGVGELVEQGAVRLVQLPDQLAQVQGKLVQSIEINLDVSDRPADRLISCSHTGKL